MLQQAVHLGRGRMRRLARSAMVGLLLLPVAVTPAPAQESSALAFIEVNVVPMDTEEVLLRYTVIVQGDRIVAIEPSDDASVPASAVRIEAPGSYLIPGLIDARAGLLSDYRIARGYAPAELAVIVANGVTTIRSATGNADLLDARDRTSREELLGPTLYVASPQLVGEEHAALPNSRAVGTSFAAAAAVRELEAEGYDFITLGPGVDADIYEGVILTARGRIPVVGNVSADVGLIRALESGQQIEHLDQYLEALDADPGATGDLSGRGALTVEGLSRVADLDEERIDDVVRATVDAEIWNTPTLASSRTTLGGVRVAGEIERTRDYRFASPGVWRELLRAHETFWAAPPDESSRLRYLALRDRIVRELYRAGGKIMAGSDAPEWGSLAGFALHRELESLVAAGLPPYAALWSATRSPAAFLSWGGAGRTEFARVDSTGIRFETATTGEVDFGRIAVGKRADMVLLAASPLDDISNSTRIEGVVLRGRWLPRAELDAIEAEAAAELSQAPLLSTSGETGRR